MNKCISKH